MTPATSEIQAHLDALSARLATADAEAGAAWSALQAEPWPQRREHGEMPLRPGHARYQRAYEVRDQLRHETYILEAALKLLSEPATAE